MMTLVVASVTGPIALAATGQDFRIGDPRRADFQSLRFDAPDPIVDTIVGATTGEQLLPLILRFGQDHRSTGVALLAMEQLARIADVMVFDEVLEFGDSVAADPHFWDLHTVTGPRALPFLSAIARLRARRSFLAFPQGDRIAMVLDTIAAGGTLGVNGFLLRYEGREGADSVLQRFLTASDDVERAAYLDAMITLDDPLLIPVLGHIMAYGDTAYGGVTRLSVRAARGLLSIGTLEALVVLRDALDVADSLGTYIGTIPVGYDHVGEWRTSHTVYYTGRTLDEWIAILEAQPPRVEVPGEADASPQAWNLAWRRDVPSSRATVSIALGNIQGGLDPRTLVRDSVRLDASMGPIEAQPHAQGTAQWEGPWITLRFRQRDVIELLPLGTAVGDEVELLLTAMLEDGTWVRAPVRVRVLGP